MGYNVYKLQAHNWVKSDFEVGDANCYRADKLMIDKHTDSHRHTDKQTNRHTHKKRQFPKAKTGLR